MNETAIATILSIVLLTSWITLCAVMGRRQSKLKADLRIIRENLAEAQHELAEAQREIQNHKSGAGRETRSGEEKRGIE